MHPCVAPNLGWARSDSAGSYGNYERVTGLAPLNRASQHTRRTARAQGATHVGGGASEKSTPKVAAIGKCVCVSPAFEGRRSVTFGEIWVSRRHNRPTSSTGDSAAERIDGPGDRWRPLTYECGCQKRERDGGARPAAVRQDRGHRSGRICFGRAGIAAAARPRRRLRAPTLSGRVSLAHRSWSADCRIRPNGRLMPARSPRNVSAPSTGLCWKCDCERVGSNACTKPRAWCTVLGNHALKALTGHEPK